MDRLMKLERKMGVIAKWFEPGNYSASVSADLAAIDAEPTDLPPARALDIETVERVLDEAGVSKVGTCAADRIQALVDEVTQRRESESKLRAERDAESRRAMAAEGERDDARSIRSRMEQHLPDDTLGLDVWDAVAKVVKDRDVARAKIARLEARDREGRDLVSRYRGLQLPGSDGANRCDSYLSGEPPKPDPRLVEAGEVLRDLSMRNRVEGGGCWCGIDRYNHERYCDRAHALLAKLDARIAAREGR